MECEKKEKKTENKKSLRFPFICQRKVWWDFPGWFYFVILHTFLASIQFRLSNLNANFTGHHKEPAMGAKKIIQHQR